MRRNLPKAALFLGKSISRFPNHVMQKHVASGNNGHLFYAFDASTNSELAFKIVPVDNLPRNVDDQYTYLNEAKKANMLMHPSVVQCVDVVPYAGPCSGSEAIGECVVFVYHYVQGINLRAYMKERRSDINLPFIESFLRTMLELLYELQQRGEQHGDLHAGNVLVAQSEFDVYNRIRFCVTDFGVQKLTGSAAHASDYLSTADTLRQLLECIAILRTFF
jgi:serine/threonine protein kinase